MYRVRAILALLLFLSSASLWAQSDDATLINITTLAQLDAIHYDMDGDGMVDASASMADSISYETAFSLARKGSITCTGGCSGYELRNNLDFEDADGNGTADDKSIWAEGAGGAGVSGAVAGGWEPLGYYNSSTDNAYYTATFDGRGHTISNLYINRPSTTNIALFGNLGRESNLRNLGIEGGSLSGGGNLGGLAGYNFGTISACYTTGTASGVNDVGGLVGVNDEGTITNSYATGNVTGSNFKVGGLVGRNDEGEIRASYAMGNVTGTGGSVGGLVGENRGGEIRACYATGNASGSRDVGGLVGLNSNTGTVTNSYFDRNVSNRPASDPYDKTTTQLQTPTAYAGIYANWNIDVDNGQPIGVDDGTAAGDPTADNPWDFGTDSQYPALSVDFDVDGSPSVAEFGTQPRTASLRVSSFTPERGVVGATVTITGTGFSTTAADNTVVFLGAAADADNRSATVSAATASSLTVTVPSGAMTGKISVMVGTVADTSSQDYTVVIGEDKDENDNGLIEVSSLEQLDAIRYDLDGDGTPSGTTMEQAAYRTAFGLSGAGTAASCTGGCEGYELMNNLDFEDADGDGAADDKSIWAEGAAAAGVPDAVADGWVLISGRFTATFEGNNYTISNLYINRSSADNVGLFRVLGAGGNVRNLGIEGGSVRGRNRVGGLVGENIGGTISDCHATVNVTASRNDVGGLVGENEGGTITNSYATGTVTGSGLTTGGLVGWNNGGAIRASYATGNVMGSGNNVGGLVGANEGGAIRACYATGNSNGGGNVGGFAGANKKKGTTNATISACYVVGNVRGSGNNVGGLVGENAATISTCYAAGSVAGGSGANPKIGGLVGENAASSAISNSYFDSTVNSTFAATPIGGGTTTGSGVTNVSGKTTADLQTPTAYGTAMDIYANWNIDVDNGQPIGVDDGTAEGDATADDPWDFGTSGQYPALQVDFDGNGTATADEFGSQRTTHFLSMRYMFDIALGISVGSEVGTVVAVPSDFNNTLSYTISSQTLNGAAVSYFLIANTAIGTISVADPAPTEVGSYTLSVEVSDGVGGTATTEVIINLLLLMSEGEFTACSGKFMDTGGSGNYDENENITMTISPESAADRVRVEFTSFHMDADVDCDYDRLEVYNGATRSAPRIGIYCGTNSPGVVLSSSADGKLTFYFKSDDTYFFSGWEATISCVPAVSVAPEVSSFTPTSGLVGATVMITGVGFSTTAAENTVTFLGEAGEADNAVVMTVSAATATELSVTVPSSAVTGKIQVEVNSVVAVSSDDFTVLMSVPPTDTDDDGLIDITTLAQLDAIRYDLDGNGVVSFTTAASLTGSPMFSNRAAVVTVMGADSIYAQAFTSGDFYTAAAGIVAETGAVAASTTYYYKLSSAATSPYTGYELRNNLDFEDADGNGTADDKSIWAEGASGAGVSGAVAEGWEPIGYYNNNGTPSNSSDDVDVSFTNTFEGNAYKISNLYINRDANYVGLFGCLGETSTLRDLGVENVSVTSTSTNSNTYAGGLVGRNDRGTITDCYSTGTVTGGEASATNLKAYALTGGLVGRNDSGTITNCYSSGTVTGRTATTTGGDALVQTGGLVGRNDDGTITNCYSSGTVTGGTATVSTSAATTNYAVDLTGGLVGDNEGGTIIACYSTVDITGGTATVSVANDAAFSRAGGLSGSNFEDGTITACYSTGTIAGGTATGGSMSAVQIGGLVGISAGAGCTIEACYSTGAVTGGSPIVHLGGLVGFDHGTTSNSYFDGTENTGITNAIGQDANPSSTTNVSGKITTELQMPVAYGTGMDIYANWNIDVDNADTDDDPATGTDDPWDFGTSSQYPALKVDFNGDGTPSAAEFGGQGRAAPTTPATVPDAPSALTAMAADAAVTLSWTAPVSDGGATITGYMIEYDTDMNFSSPPTTATTATAATSYTVSGLTNGTLYYFRVAAVNGVGTGASATAVSATPVAPATVPDAPEVSSFTPEMGVVGATVMITGTGFSTTAAENTVTFLGEEANDADNVEAIISTSPAPTAASLTVTVPLDAQTGKISVMVGTAADTSDGSFTVSSGPAILTVSDFTPTSGAVGETVMITGTGFSTTAAENTVTFLGEEANDADNVEAIISTSPAPTAASLTVTVPLDAQTGKISVMVGTAADTSAASFTVSSGPAILTVSDFTPTSGAVGETVMITGTGFSTTAAENTVTFLGSSSPGDEQTATVNTARATELTVTLPVSAMTGKIQVEVNSVMAVSSDDFTVLTSVPPTDMDADGLIDITTLAQLDAIRYDLDGDGRPTSAGQTAWQTAFSAVAVSDDDAAVRDASTGFTGYELMNSLDFDNVSGSPSIWSENCTDGACQTATAVDGDNADKVGWAPIGDNSNAYTATFDGRGRTISNLYIDRPSTSRVGLFGYLDTGGNVRNLGIEGGSVTGDGYVGGLVGESFGTISACYATGNATGDDNVGGLVGDNDGTISACYATGNATGIGDYVGGLVGNSEGTISACYATGDVSGRSWVGGLVGQNFGGTISACYATGAAIGSGSAIGGLVGENFGTTSACYATGDASGDDNVGGLVGDNIGGTISACYARGNATGTGDYVGGLVGYNSSTIRACYATGNASGTSSVGGLVGSGTGGTVTNSYFDSDASNRPAADSYDKTTVQLQTPTAYGTAMDIYANWNIDVDNGQPIGVDDGTAEGDATADDPWDFGTDSEYPALRVDFNVNGTPTAFEFGGQGRAVPATVPDALAALTATAADAEVTLSWTAAASDGAPITGYMIEHDTDMNFPSPTTVTTTDAATSYTVSGLTNGTLYYFRVAAVNTAGTAAYYPGASDAAVSATPAPATPAAPPVVSSFTPTSGAVGATVTITGTDFSTTAADNTVTFLGDIDADADNQRAIVSAAAATSLTVSVPSTAQTGKISVMVGTAADTSAASFTVTVSAPAPAAPVVLSFSPTEGEVDTEVTITGVNFSDMSSENEVRFGGVMAAAPTSASTTSLVVLVPSGAVTGRVSVAVGGQTGTSSENFTVTAPAPAPAAPVVSSFSPTEGVVDTEVTITGVNFSDMSSENEVRFGGVMAAEPTSARLVLLL